MRAALVVHRIAPDTDANLRAILDGVAHAASAGADLVVYSEAALTGLINDDTPAHDLPLGTEVPGPATERLARAAAAHGVWLGLGLLEREETRLYDSALLFTPEGEIGLRYRRIQPQWHGREADPLTYRQGSEIPVLDTPLGRFGFLICGDLYDDEIVERTRALCLDWLLFPFARCFSDGSCVQARWNREEEPAYVRRARRTGTTTLMVNHVAEASLLGGAFGGALAVRDDGTVLARLPLGREDALLVDLPGREASLDDLQPSQLYVSAAKLDSVLADLDREGEPSMPPLPVIRMGDAVVLTDGHTRAFAAWSRGWTHVPVAWDRDELDREAYRICVAWCREANVLRTADLNDRVVDVGTYQRLWLDRCAAMHRALDDARATAGGTG